MPGQHDGACSLPPRLATSLWASRTEGSLFTKGQSRHCSSFCAKQVRGAHKAVRLQPEGIAAETRSEDKQHGRLFLQVFEMLESSLWKVTANSCFGPNGYCSRPAFTELRPMLKTPGM